VLDVVVRLISCLKVVATFSDVRVLAIGVLHTPRSSLTVNQNARAFLHPPGIAAGSLGADLNQRLHDSPYGEDRRSTSGNDDEPCILLLDLW